MKYKDLIKRFEPYAEEEVTAIIDWESVAFFPLSDGNTCIIDIYTEPQEPFKVYEKDI